MQPDIPRTPLKLLKWFCPSHLHEAIEGDLLEWWERDCEELGASKARRRLYWNAIRFFRPGIVARRKISSQTRMFMTPLPMIRTSFRNLKAHRSTALINAIGLAIGISSTLIILSILKFEMSFDQFHSDAERIYRVVRVSQVEGQEEYRTGTVYPLAPAIEADMATVELQTSMLYWDWEDLKVAVHADDATRRKLFSESTGVAMVEPSFFEMFDFKGTGFRWLAGNPTTALEEPFAVVLTESIARKYFGDDDPMGEILSVNNDSEYKVTGVIADLPPNTDFPFKVLLSYATLVHYTKDRRHEWWPVGDNQLYIKTMPGATIDELNAQLHQVHAARTPESLHSFRRYKVQPLNEVHSDVRFGNYNHRIVSNQKVWTLAAVGLFLLIAACINYINLATARASLRGREIGVRKVLGSSRRELIAQFMTESFILTLISGVLGLIVAELVSNQFQQLLSAPSTTWLMADPFLWLGLGAILVIVTFFAGFYPALIISGFHPLKALKGITDQRGHLHIRRTLVIVQFGLTIAFIVGTLTVLRQVSYFQKVDLGFQREAIVNLDVPDNGGALDVFASELKSHPAIHQVSFTSSIPSGLYRPANFWDIKRSQVQGEGLVTEVQQIDSVYFSVYGIEIVAGRNFRPADEKRSVIINETLAKKLDYKTAEDAIGQEVHIGGSDLNVVGVVNDFHSKSLKDEIDKLTFLYHCEEPNVVSIRFASPEGGITPEITRKALKHIEASWASVFPDDAMNYRFFDDNINGFYEEEVRFSSLLQVFTVVLIAIGCLGLYGLISFVVHRRMKEVAIRKTFGASFGRILQLLTSDFLKLVVVAFAIATPLSYFLMQRWLTNFVYHINVTWWMLAIPLLVVVAIAVTIVTTQSMKAARVNPAKILRDE